MSPQRRRGCPAWRRSVSLRRRGGCPAWRRSVSPRRRGGCPAWRRSVSPRRRRGCPAWRRSVSPRRRRGCPAWRRSVSPRRRRGCPAWRRSVSPSLGFRVLTLVRRCIFFGTGTRQCKPGEMVYWQARKMCEHLSHNDDDRKGKSRDIDKEIEGRIGMKRPSDEMMS